MFMLAVRGRRFQLAMCDANLYTPLSEWGSQRRLWKPCRAINFYCTTMRSCIISAKKTMMYAFLFNALVFIAAFQSTTNSCRRPQWPTICLHALSGIYVMSWKEKIVSRPFLFSAKTVSSAWWHNIPMKTTYCRKISTQNEVCVRTIGLFSWIKALTSTLIFEGMS